MNIEDTLAAYKEALAGCGSVTAASLEKEKSRRAQNAEYVKEHLREIVLPVLKDSESKIKASGFDCKISELFFSTSSVFRAQLTIGDKEHERGEIAYEGSDETATIRAERSINRARAIPFSGSPFSCTILTGEEVRSQVEAFVQEAFPV